MNRYQTSPFSMPPVVKNLILINVLMWIAKYPFMNMGIDLTEKLGLHYIGSPLFRPYQLVTHLFMHGDFFHLLFNMFALYMFGGILEQVWGTKRFLFYYLLTGVGAGIVQQLFWTVEFNSALTAMNHAIATDLINAPALIEQKRLFLDSPAFITIGASGAVFGLLLAFWWLFPDYKLFVFPIPIPIKARILIPIFALYELYSGYQMNPNDNVAHFAHLGGMLFGAILIFIWKKKKTL